jgi:hypothetical protein
MIFVRRQPSMMMTADCQADGTAKAGGSEVGLKILRPACQWHSKTGPHAGGCVRRTSSAGSSSVLFQESLSMRKKCSIVALLVLVIALFAGAGAGAASLAYQHPYIRSPSDFLLLLSTFRKHFGRPHLL